MAGACQRENHTCGAARLRCRSRTRTVRPARRAGREGARFKLSAQSTYRPPSGGGALGYEIVDGKIDIKGPEGEALYDTKTGRLVKSTRKTRIHGRLKIKVNGQSATMIVDNRETTQVRLLKPADLAAPPAKAKAK